MAFLGETKIAELAAGRRARQTLRALLPPSRWFLQVWNRWSQTWLPRFVSRNLRRRIIISNLAGLAVLVIGWIVLSQQNVWLIDAKRDALETQSRIIAAAVATAGTTGLRDRNDIDPDSVPYVASEKFTFDESTLLADVDLSLRPEQVAPVLSQLIKGTTTRARVYDVEGVPIVDSEDFKLRGAATPTGTQPADLLEIKPKNFWTRALSWRVQSPLTVYQDLDNLKGTSFKEVSKAISKGTSDALLLMTGNGEQVVAYATPIVRLGQVKGALLLSTKPGEIDDLLSEERLRILILTILAFSATLIASVLLARTVAGPMRRLSAAAERVSVDINASRDLPVFSGREDEVGQMSASFAKMTESLRRRIEASEKFAADVAHELKNPLTAARSTAEALKYAKTESQRDELVETINEELKRLNRLISDVSNASRLDAELARQQTEIVDLERIISGQVETFRDLSTSDESNPKITFSVEPGTETPLVDAHEGRICQVLMNLIDNAISFSPDGGDVKISLAASPTHVDVRIDDDGPGIEPDKLETIFDRFYTYRPTELASRGTNSGLGLSISREIVKAHGGEIWAENRPAGGSRFVIRLPRLLGSRTTNRSRRTNAA